jgi:hypothetical protein
MDKTILQLHFFPIADIISSLTLGLYAFRVINGDNFTTLEIYFPTPCL